MTTTPYSAAAQAARSPRLNNSAPAPVPDPAFDAARQAYEALPSVDRMTIQDALVWTGDYNSTLSGSLGRRTFDAIVAWQKRSGVRATGVLTEQERSALVVAGASSRDATGFAEQADAGTGIRLGVPRLVLPKAGRNASGGGRWQSADGKATLELRRMNGSTAEFDALFTRDSAQQPGRMVSYKLQRPDFFVISGETVGGRYFTRYALGPGGIRGFSLSYDKSVAPSFDRLVIAITNSFVPFPDGAAPVTAAASIAVPADSAPSANATRPGADDQTGFVVGPNRVLTAKPGSECPSLMAGGARAEIVKQDDLTGLALLGLDRNLKAAPVRVRSDPISPGGELVALFIDAETNRLVVTSGTALADTRFLAALQPGATGAVLTDRTGALVGVAGRFSPGRVRIAGLVPPRPAAYVDAATLRPYLKNVDAGPTPDANSLSVIVERLTPAVVRVSCQTAR